MKLGITLLASVHPAGPYWQLGPLPARSGAFLLIAWTSPTPPIDSGVPSVVAEVLCRAWTMSNTLTFPVSEGTSVNETATLDDYKTWKLNEGLFRYLTASLRSEPSEITMVSTRGYRGGVRLFTDEKFPWHLQGQVALLDRGSGLELTRPQLLSLMDEDWVMHAQELAGSGIQAVVRPGVDGDVIGLWSVTEQVQESLMQAMETEAQRAGIGWRRVNEDELMAQLAQN